MALYTRKKGEFVALTKDQVRRLRRNDQVIALQVSSMKVVMAMRALAALTGEISRRSHDKGSSPFTFTAVDVMRLPDREIMEARCAEVVRCIDELRGPNAK